MDRLKPGLWLVATIVALVTAMFLTQSDGERGRTAVTQERTDGESHAPFGMVPTSDLAPASDFAGAALEREEDPEVDVRSESGPIIVGRAFSEGEVLPGLRVRVQFVTDDGQVSAPLERAPASVRSLQPIRSFCVAVPNDSSESSPGAVRRVRLTTTSDQVPLLTEVTVEVHPTGLTDLGDVVLSPPPIAASGVVVDQHGAPIADVWVGERVEGPAMVGTARRVQSALDGTFQVRNHERGETVTLEAELEGSDPATVTVERGGRVTIVVHRRLAIRGKIVWRLDAPKRLGAVHATCLSTGETSRGLLSPDGSFACFVEDGGEYHLEFGGPAWVGPRLSLLPRLDVTGDVDVGVLDVSLDVFATRVTAVDDSGGEIDLLTLWCYAWGPGYPTSFVRRMGQSRSIDGHHLLLHGLGTHQAVLNADDRLAIAFVDGRDVHVELRPHYEVILWPRRRAGDWDDDEAYGVRPSGNFDPRQALTTVGLTGAMFHLPHPGRWDVWIAPQADFSMEGPPLTTIDVQDRREKQSFHVDMRSSPAKDD